MGSHLSPNWFSRGSCIPIELEFGGVRLSRGRKIEVSREKPLQQGGNQQKTQPTDDKGAESNPGRIGGRRELTPQHYPSPQ